MSTKIGEHISSRLYSLGRAEHQYIVPTLDGIKFLLLNLILLIIGLAYANNYVLLFNFVLFCFFIGSMFYTHFNIQGLKLVSVRLNPLHAGEDGFLSLSFQSQSTLGHHFLSLKIKKNPFIKLQDEQFTFSFDPGPGLLQVDIPLSALKRGKGGLPRLSLETSFPFHLFRSFIYFDHPFTYVIYPERRNLGIHKETLIPEEKKSDGEDFILKEFYPGDSLKRVHWKKLAQTNHWYSKHVLAPNATPVILSFSSVPLSAADIEQELRSLCFALHRLHSQNMNYGLQLGKTEISPDHSYLHLNRCLKALAEYET